MEILNPKLAKDIEAGVPLRLELGSGGASKRGLYALDLRPLPGVDALADLTEPLDLIPDDSVEYVYSRHVLEHLRDLDLVMAELQRITRHDGIIEIIVPHFTNPYGYSDPTHVRFFGLYSMHYYVEPEKQDLKRRVPAFYSSTRFEIESIDLAFYRLTRLDRLLAPRIERFLNRSLARQDFYERRLSPFYHAWQITYRLRPDKPPGDRAAS